MVNFSPSASYYDIQIRNGIQSEKVPAYFTNFRDRSEDLRTKLKAVDAQLDAAAVAMSNIRYTKSDLSSATIRYTGLG